MQLNIPPVIENIEEIKAIYDAESWTAIRK